MDSDGQHDPGEIEKILAPVAAGELDLAIGSRFFPGSEYESGLARDVGRRIICSLARLLGFKLEDPTSGFQAMNRDVIRLYCRDTFLTTTPTSTSWSSPAAAACASASGQRRCGPACGRRSCTGPQAGLLLLPPGLGAARHLDRQEGKPAMNGAPNQPPVRPDSYPDLGWEQALIVGFSLMLLLVVLWLVKQNRLREDYTPIWLMASLAAFVLAISQKLLHLLAWSLGAWTLSSALFFLAIVFLILICLQYAVRLSRLHLQVKNLSQEVALLRAALAAKDEPGRLSEGLERRDPEAGACGRAAACLLRARGRRRSRSRPVGCRRGRSSRPAGRWRGRRRCRGLSIMQPSRIFRPWARAVAMILRAGAMPPHLASLTLMPSNASASLGMSPAWCRLSSAMRGSGLRFSARASPRAGPI